MTWTEMKTVFWKMQYRCRLVDTATINGCKNPEQWVNNKCE